jgi:hypothetical protein
LVADVRSRAAAVVASAAVMTSILGGAPVGGGHHGAAVYVATAAFVSVASSAFAVLWLAHVETMVDPGALIREYAEPSHMPLALVHRDLAIHRATSIALNRRTIDRMTVLLRVAVGSLAAEVVAWVVNSALAL